MPSDLTHATFDFSDMNGAIRTDSTLASLVEAVAHTQSVADTGSEDAIFLAMRARMLTLLFKFPPAFVRANPWLTYVDTVGEACAQTEEQLDEVSDMTIDNDPPVDEGPAGYIFESHNGAVRVGAAYNLYCQGVDGFWRMCREVHPHQGDNLWMELTRGLRGFRLTVRKTNLTVRVMNHGSLRIDGVDKQEKLNASAENPEWVSVVTALIRVKQVHEEGRRAQANIKASASTVGAPTVVTGTMLDESDEDTSLAGMDGYTPMLDFKMDSRMYANGETHWLYMSGTHKGRTVIPKRIEWQYLDDYASRVGNHMCDLRPLDGIPPFMMVHYAHFRELQAFGRDIVSNRDGSKPATKAEERTIIFESLDGTVRVDSNYELWFNVVTDTPDTPDTPGDQAWERRRLTTLSRENSWWNAILQGLCNTTRGDVSIIDGEVFFEGVTQPNTRAGGKNDLLWVGIVDALVAAKKFMDARDHDMRGTFTDLVVTPSVGSEAPSDVPVVG